MEGKRNKELLSYSVITGILKGEQTAMEEMLIHYDRKIRWEVGRRLRIYGLTEWVDDAEEIVQNVKLSMMKEIRKFKIRC